MHILVDIGGTKTRVAGTSDLQALGEPQVFATPQKYEEGIAAIAQHAREIAGNSSVDGLAGGVPAMLSRDRRAIIGAATNIPAWDGKPIADDLERALGAHVMLENDTALVGLGEALFGAGQGAEIMMYLTVSTGVNGARIVGGNIDAAAFGFSVGHQYLETVAPLRNFEQMVAGRAIAQRFGVASPRDLGKEHPVWEDLARAVAFGVHNSIVHWSPDRVVLGGSMFNDVGIVVDRVQAHLKEITLVTAEMPEIAHAALADMGGLWGALALLQQKRH